MNKTRLFQALWLLFLSVLCVLMFYFRRESTKHPQEVLARTETARTVETVSLTSAPASVSAPVRTPPEVTEVLVPVAATPAPSAAPTPQKATEVFVPVEGTSAPAYTLPPGLSPASPAASPTPFATPEPVEPFSLIWFSDTQYYAYKRPEIFLSMADWVVRVKDDCRTVAVICTGDIVDNRNYSRHWENADKAISRIRDVLPFYCVAGNHDVGADTVDYSIYRKYDFCTAPETMEFYDDGRCWVLPLSEQGILLCGVGWQNDTQYADWLIDAIAGYPDLTAVLLTHSFLSDDGSLSANGKRVERDILRSAPTVRLVLCGHNDGSARWEKTYPDGHTVNAMMYNFQDDKKYGLGYARILMFNPGTRNVAVTTYSPFLDDYNYYRDSSKDTFTLYDAW